MAYPTSHGDASAIKCAFGQAAGLRGVVLGVLLAWLTLPALLRATGMDVVDRLRHRRRRCQAAGLASACPARARSDG
ncbi:MAG: hypothetical protein ACFCGT_27780 [Sandaracinaceae bacterium]